MATLLELSHALETGQRSARDLVEEALARIGDPGGEGARVFLKVYEEQARASADHIDRMRAFGAAPSRFAGIPISIKDLFDVAGDVTTAGSVVLRDNAAAHRDAPAVARLKAAGLIPIGRTNMTEFAFSGLGLNPHYGTPRNPYERDIGRIPGGSSSGAAVSVTDGMAFGALGTDTGGSCRIPAAFTGLVGFKPTAIRVPLDGVVPLSPSLDSVGSIGVRVACCATLDAMLVGAFSEASLPAVPLEALRLAIPQNYVLDSLDSGVSAAFERAMHQLSARGVRVSEIPLRELMELPTINGKGGFPAAEAYAWHRRLLSEKAHLYDPRVSARILRGQKQDAADYIDLVTARTDLIGRVNALTVACDAIVMPTVPIVAPPIVEVETDETYGRMNLLVLRNATVANFLDRCAVSVPCHQAGDAPVGLMLVGAHGADRQLLAIAAAVEAALSPPRR